MDRDEALHGAIELAEPGLDRVELAPGVELAAKRIAQVVHASARPVRDLERAAAGPAKRTARVIAGWRYQVAGAGPRARERADLVVVEQVRRHAGAASSAVVATPRQRLAGRARATRRNGAQRLRHALLRRQHSACEGALLVVDVSGPLVAQAPPELHQLVGP